MEWIRILIPISLFEGQDLNLKGMDSNPDFRKGLEGLLKEVDSNPHETDLNLDSSKFAWIGWIGISIK